MRNLKIVHVLSRSLVFAAVMTLMTGTALAGPGDLDPTFGLAGIYTDPVSNHPCFGLYPTASTLDAAGKILVVGYIYDKCAYAAGNNLDNTRRVLLRRYKANGLPDDGALRSGGFGMDGFAVADIPNGPDVYGLALDVTTQPDGKILVAGIRYTTFGKAAAIWRFTPTGELDTSFGTDGVVLFTGWVSDEAAVRVIASGDKVFVAGTSRIQASSSVWIRKLNTDGTPHVWFGQSGKISTSLKAIYGPGFDVNGTAGEIAVSDATYTPAAGWVATVAKYSTSGSAITTFGVNGTVQIPVCVTATAVWTSISAPLVKFQSNGKLVTLSADLYSTIGTLGMLRRLNNDGSIDSTFGDPAQCSRSQASAFKWIQTSTSDTIYTGAKRFSPSGVLDASFNPGVGNGSMSANVRQPDGKIIFQNYTTTDKPDHIGFDTYVVLSRVLP